MSIPPPNPLSYEGQVAVPFIVVRNASPGTNPNFEVPTVWIDPPNKNAFLCVSKALGVGTWLNLGNPGPTGPVTQMTGNAGTNPIYPNATTGNVNVLGDGVNINSTGDGVETLTLTLKLPAAGVVTTTGVAGSALGSVAGNDGVLVTSHTGTPSLLPNSGTAGFVLTANTNLPPSWQANPLNAFTKVDRKVFVYTGGAQTYTPTAGMKYCDIEVFGGGGGGQGSTTAGGNGGTTSVGALISADGGTGGNGAPPILGGSGHNGDYQVTGSCGQYAYANTMSRAGDSIFGGGGIGDNALASAGVAFGAGGGGGSTLWTGAGGGYARGIFDAATIGASQPLAVTVGVGGTAGTGVSAGAAGFPGAVIVTEYL